MCADHACTAVPGGCATDADCPAGVCKNGRCAATPGQQSCVSDRDCGAGQICPTPGGACAAGCRTSSDCPSGTCNSSFQCVGGDTFLVSYMDYALGDTGRWG